MKRLALAALSVVALSVTAFPPVLALSERLEYERQSVIDRRNEQFDQKRTEILNQLSDRAEK